MNNNSIIHGFDDEKVQALEINIRKEEWIENSLVLYLSGYIDTYNATAFQKKVEKVVDAGFTRLIFNCAGLNYVSSAGIGAFTSFLKTLKNSGGEMVLVAMQKKVLEVFKLLGFLQFFIVKDNQEEAINALRQKSSIPQASSSFLINCPGCGKGLQANKAGRFRCAICKAVFTVSEDGDVHLG